MKLLENQPMSHPCNLKLKLLCFSIKKVLNQLLWGIRNNPRLCKNKNKSKKKKKKSDTKAWTYITEDPFILTCLRAWRRSFSSRTWRWKASRASASFSSRRLNSRRAICPVFGDPNRPSGSFNCTKISKKIQT